MSEIRYAIGTGASQPSVAAIPAGAHVFGWQVKVTTPFSGGATLQLGQTGTANLIADTSDTDLTDTTGEVQAGIVDVLWGASALPLLSTIGGVPVAGAAVIIVQYSTAVSA